MNRREKAMRDAALTVTIDHHPDEEQVDIALAGADAERGRVVAWLEAERRFWPFVWIWFGRWLSWRIFNGEHWSAAVADGGEKGKRLDPLAEIDRRQLDVKAHSDWGLWFVTVETREGEFVGESCGEHDDFRVALAAAIGDRV